MADSVIQTATIEVRARDFFTQVLKSIGESGRRELFGVEQGLKRVGEAATTAERLGQAAARQQQRTTAQLLQSANQRRDSERILLALAREAATTEAERAQVRRAEIAMERELTLERLRATGATADQIGAAAGLYERLRLQTQAAESAAKANRDLASSSTQAANASAAQDSLGGASGLLGAGAARAGRLVGKRLFNTFITANVFGLALQGIDLVVNDLLGLDRILGKVSERQREAEAAAEEHRKAVDDLAEAARRFDRSLEHGQFEKGIEAISQRVDLLTAQRDKLLGQKGDTVHLQDILGLAPGQVSPEELERLGREAGITFSLFGDPNSTISTADAIERLNAALREEQATLKGLEGLDVKGAREAMAAAAKRQAAEAVAARVEGRKSADEMIAALEREVQLVGLSSQAREDRVKVLDLEQSLTKAMAPEREQELADFKAKLSVLHELEDAARRQAEADKAAAEASSRRFAAAQSRSQFDRFAMELLSQSGNLTPGLSGGNVPASAQGFPASAVPGRTLGLDEVLAQMAAASRTMAISNQAVAEQEQAINVFEKQRLQIMGQLNLSASEQVDLINAQAQAQLEALSAQEQQGQLTADQFENLSALIDRMRKERIGKTFEEDVSRMDRVAEQAQGILVSSLASSLADIALESENAGDAFLNFARLVVRGLVEIAAQQAALSIIGALFSGGASSIVPVNQSFTNGGSGTSPFSSIGGGLVVEEKGGIVPGSIEALYPTRYFAAGGVATSPSLAVFAEKPGMAEAFVPLPDGKTIPVTLIGAQNGQGGVSIVQNISLAGIDTRDLKQRMDEIADHLGDITTRQLGKNYGLVQRVRRTAGR